MYKIFKFPQDLWWVISQSLAILSIIFSCINYNLIALLISISVFLCFLFLWFKFIFWPWYKIKKSLRFSYKNIKFCYYKNIEDKEKNTIINEVEEIENKIETSIKISQNCIQSAFNDIIVMFSDDINEKYFNKRFGTSYKRISGLALGKLIMIDISNGFENSALKHELCHVVLDVCFLSLSETEQHNIMLKIGV